MEIYLFLMTSDELIRLGLVVDEELVYMVQVQRFLK